MSEMPSITVTHVLEHLYCPRFTYFEYVLAVPERQERRWKVQRGREVHRWRQQVNKDYLRKRLGVVE
jgi:CRISPR-associated exonuclease Cas4